MEISNVQIEVMPEINAPKMIKIDFSVPEPLYQQALELAEAEGWKPAELFRVFWVMGFAAHAEGSNKRMVNRNLRKHSNSNNDADS